MPSSIMTLFPHVLNTLEAMKIPIQTKAALAETAIHSNSLGFGLMKNTLGFVYEFMRNFLPLAIPMNRRARDQFLAIWQEGSMSLLSFTEKTILDYWGRYHRERLGELEFLNLFTDKLPPQDWAVEYDDTHVLLDLPSLRLLDISVDMKHKIQNYGVVFAPRAGHHSNIAERVALYLRNKGLTRMSIVEQKCAEDIPLYPDGERHYEDFDGQVEQYRQVLERLKGMTGYAPHLIAVCQPGPLLMSTLILYPHLGKTFGSAGAPMHTEAQRGFLTDFARTAGEDYIDRLISFSGLTVSDDYPGAGRESFDGRLHILGFYILGMDQHVRNFKKLLTDLKQGNEEAAERQKTFYQWYNCVHHSPAGFIRDTFKKIFIRNELIQGTLSVGGKKIGIKDYPSIVPVWALGGSEDDITPSLQATGHLELIESVPPQRKLTLTCEAGHMGLFRAKKILKDYYSRIAEFILSHSDKVKRD
jgi:polyhydroxyalkanoate depolymerase